MYSIHLVTAQFILLIFLQTVDAATIISHPTAGNITLGLANSISRKSSIWEFPIISKTTWDTLSHAGLPGHYKLPAKV
jgi:hypothetical protein